MTKSFWPPKPEGDDEDAADEDSSKPKVEYETVTEMERLRAMVDEITSLTDLAPAGTLVINATGDIVPNPLFSGLEYPDKLESYFHKHAGPKGALPDVPVLCVTTARWSCTSSHCDAAGTLLCVTSCCLGIGSGILSN